MARAKRTNVEHDVYQRTIFEGTPRERTVFDVKVSNGWISGLSSIREARAKRAEMESELYRGTFDKSRPVTVAQYAERWLEQQRKRVDYGSARGGLRKLAPSTYANYERDLRKHIVPVIGHKKLRDVRLDDLQAIFNDLADEGRASYTLHNIRKPLSLMLDKARKNALIHSNPALDVELPSAVREKEPIRLTRAEVLRLVACAPTDDDRRLIHVAALTGLRQGEAFGLRWNNVVLQPEGNEVPVIKVREQVYKGEHTTRLKTKKARRDVELSGEAIRVLSEQHVSGRQSRYIDIAFPATRGGWHHASNWDRRVWIPTRKKAGLPDAVTFHHLRTFFLSTIRDAGLPLSLTMDAAGHSDERTHDGYVKRDRVLSEAVRKVYDAALTLEETEPTCSTEVAPEGIA